LPLARIALPIGAVTPTVESCCLDCVSTDVPG
jgi:hypothetical protein